MRVIVIGAGVAGAGTAYQLARRGVEVVVVDDGRSGAATAAGAGIVSPWAGADPDPLALAAAGHYPQLVAALAEDTDEPVSYAVVGQLVTSADEAALREVLRRARAVAAEHPAAGEVALLGPDEARALFPPLAPGLGAVRVGGGARVDGRQVRASLLAAARGHGAEVRTGTAALDADGARVDGSPLAADAVVVAAGAWTGRLVAPLGTPVPIDPQRGQITHLRVGADEGTGAWQVVSPLGSGHYLLAFPDARVVVGATRETGAGFEDRVTAAGQLEVLANALTVAPGLHDATPLETRVGLRPATPDGRPVLGPLPGRPGVVLAGGFGATGLTVAPYAGVLVADLLLGEPARLDLAPYRPDRFAT